MAAGSTIGFLCDQTIYHPGVRIESLPFFFFFKHGEPHTTLLTSASCATFKYLDIYMSAATSANVESAGSGATWFKIFEMVPQFTGNGYTFPSQNLPGVNFTIPSSVPSGLYFTDPPRGRERSHSNLDPARRPIPRPDRTHCPSLGFELRRRPNLYCLRAASGEPPGWGRQDDITRI